MYYNKVYNCVMIDSIDLAIITLIISLRTTTYLRNYFSKKEKFSRAQKREIKNFQKILKSRGGDGKEGSSYSKEELEDLNDGLAESLQKTLADIAVHSDLMGQSDIDRLTKKDFVRIFDKILFQIVRLIRQNRKHRFLVRHLFAICRFMLGSHLRLWDLGGVVTIANRKYVFATFTSSLVTGILFSYIGLTSTVLSNIFFGIFVVRSAFQNYLELIFCDLYIKKMQEKIQSKVEQVNLKISNSAFDFPKSKLKITKTKSQISEETKRILERLGFTGPGLQKAKNNPLYQRFKLKKAKNAIRSFTDNSLIVDEKLEKITENMKNLLNNSKIE